MEEYRTFEQRRWPLHFALAWVLTRDRAFAERAKASDFHPRLDRDSQDEVDRAWRILHASLADGRVPAFKVSEPVGYLACAAFEIVARDGHVGEANEERIAPEALASLDWADLTKDDSMVVSSNAMMSVFPSGSDPVAFTSDHIGPAIRPVGPGFMTLSDAAYWIATEGGTKRIAAPRGPSVWAGAFAELLPRMQSSEVHVVGRRRGARVPEVIDAASFVGLRVYYPYVDTPRTIFFGKEPYIKCYGPLIPESWVDQFSDEYFGLNRKAADWHVPEWSHLQVDRADVRKWWGFPKTKEAVQHRVNTEKQAIAVLAQALKENKDLTRSQAKACIGDGIGQRAFQYRVWPEARKLAGLPPIAPRGRRKMKRYA